MSTVKLGVNIDHVATIRNARGTVYPQPVEAATIAQANGADSITMHLREDRRHIIDSDLFAVKDAISIPLNMEMAVTDEMLAIAKDLRPAYCCLVPEKRQELTTECGLDVVTNRKLIARAIDELSQVGVVVSLFIAADTAQIAMAKELAAPVIELHTGQYADAEGAEQQAFLQQITRAAHYAHELGLVVNAGHGLHYDNTTAITTIPHMHELNIGHSIVARAVLTGFAEAVGTMKKIVTN